jgi:Mg-chelatase subunit ChlD
MHIFTLVTNDDIFLDIFRAKSHSDQTGNLTPLVVSLSSIDKSEKVKGVDLICIVDVSGSMSGDKIQLVRESLKYLVNLMNEQDNIALITFASYTDIICNFTKMNSYNKNIILDDISNLNANGGTNIYSALREGLGFVKHDYSSGERIASMILLSDGEDNYYDGDSLSNLFRQLLIDTGKSNYIFTLHTLGFGADHDYNLMNKLSLIKDGGYFAIQRLLDVQDAYLKIYGSLSTICSVNVKLTIQSNFKIEKVYGMEDMYEASLKNNTKISIFQTTLIQVIYGKNYYFVVLVFIPENTPFGTEVLNATISPLGISKKYLWDETYSNIAYEEYIRCISFTYFSDGYNLGYNGGVAKIEEGREWIEVNYTGVRNWIGEFDDVLYDMNNNFNYGGAANILSKLRELKTSQIGIHYNNNENTYISNILYGSHNIDISNLPFTRIVGQTIIKFDININYYYFYLKEGFGEINNLPFSGYGSSLIIYSDDSSGTINITSLSDYIEYYYWNETKTRIQNIIDFSKGGKFIFEKDFPYEFYSRVDGTKDITFNIEFLKLEINEISNTVEHLFEIIAYIIDDREIQNLEYNIDSLPSTTVYNGYYDSKLSLGNIVIKKEEISRYLSSTSHSYLYIIIKKITSNINIIYKHVEGQFIFVSMDNIYSVVPVGFCIFSYLPRDQKSPHLYTLQGKNITIEFSSLGNDLDCKILKYQNYPTGSEELYIDYNKFIINRREDINKTYINVVQDNNENTTTDNLIISIFSKKQFKFQ